MDFDSAKPPRHDGHEFRPVGVNVAPHRSDRRNCLKLIEHNQGTNVAGVKDFVYSL
jgi:hypothetical protein